MLEFTKEELEEIREAGVNTLELSYQRDYEDIDLCLEPADRFDLDPCSIEKWQSIIIKIDGK